MKIPMVMSALVLAGLSVAASAQESAPTAKVETGTLAGVAQDGVLSWKGIPFAAPPTGNLRWRAPQPAKAWSGVRQATSYASDCMQKPFGGDAAPLGTPPAEDCLYANVWRPEKAEGKLPVLVWIYGGGFINGGASPATYSGAELAKKGVLVFSFNYRIGRFGFFAHPALTKADPDNGKLVNYGYMDQVAALEWVKRNIAAFGGDPDNVTIAGESAGGNSVDNLLTLPAAKGLFDKAVVMSGGNGKGFTKSSMETAHEAGVAFAKKKGITGTGPAALEKLRALSGEDVVDGLNLMALFAPQEGPVTYTLPVIDGVTAAPQRSNFESGDFAHVPVMIGATAADIGGVEGQMVAGARKLAKVIGEQGVPVYEYRFSYVADSVAAPGAQHATDIPFFFDTQRAKYGEETSVRDNAMGDAMSSYLVNFARTGAPSTGWGLPAWKPYAEANGQIMDFATDGKVHFRDDPWQAEIDAADM